MSKCGYFLVARGWMDNPALAPDEVFTKRDAWLWLVEHAAFRDTRLDVHGKTVAISRGQLCHSFRSLATAWGWSLGVVQRFVARLEADTMISTRSDTGRMVITLVNYERYQTPSKGSVVSDDTERDTEQDTNAIHPRYAGDTQKKEGKEGKEKKEESSLRSLPPACAAGDAEVPPVDQVASAQAPASATAAQAVPPFRQDASAVVVQMPGQALAVPGSLFGETAPAEAKPKARSRKHGAEPDGFAEWYALYPLKKARDDAAKAFPRAVAAAGSLERLMAFTRSFQFRTGADVRFNPHPATWLNGRRWTDQPVVDTADGRVVRFPNHQQSAAGTSGGLGPEPSRNSPEWLRWRQERVRAEAKARQGDNQSDGPIIDGFAERMA